MDERPLIRLVVTAVFAPYGVGAEYQQEPRVASSTATWMIVQPGGLPNSVPAFLS